MIKQPLTIVFFALAVLFMFSLVHQQKTFRLK